MRNSLIFSLRLSLQVSLTATFFVAISGTATAYLLAKREFRGKEVVDIVLTLPLVMPPTVTGYYLVTLFGRNGYIGGLLYQWAGVSIMFTWYAAVLASFVVAFPLMMKTARAAIESVDHTLINASYTLGRSEFETAVKVVLPLAKRGLVAGTVLSFARALGEFGATLMIAGNIPGKTDTMPIAIWSAAGSGEWGNAHAMVAVLTVMSTAFLYFAGRYGRRFL